MYIHEHNFDVFHTHSHQLINTTECAVACTALQLFLKLSAPLSLMGPKPARCILIVSVVRVFGGGTVYYVFKNKDVKLPHAVLIKEGLVFDMDYKVMTVAEYEKKNTILKSVKMVFGEGYIRTTS